MQDDYERGFEAMARAAQHALAYRKAIAEAPTTPVSGYSELLAAFSGPTPEQGAPPEFIIDELAELAIAGVRAITAPRFFGWVIGGSHPTGVAADWLTSAWGQNAGNVLAAPAAAAVEAVAAGWLKDLLGLPASASVGMVTGGTMANFTCLASARGELLRRVGWDVDADGLFGAPPIEVLIGADAHATVFAGLRYLGLGAKRVRRIETDESGRMRPAAFERELRNASGPVLAVAQAGQINSGACDNFEILAPMTREAGAWLHVDGAFGLWAQACPQRAHVTRGVEHADSWATDGHKWLQTPYDCGFAIVRDPHAHLKAMDISASYLPPAEESERDPALFVPELSRRARGFAVWAMIRHYGRTGVAELVERSCAIAQHMAERLARESGIEIVCPVELNQFMVRFGAEDMADELTLAVVNRLQEEAVAFFGPARWRGRWVMRVSVMSGATTLSDADLSVDAILRTWRSVGAAPGVAIA